MEIRNYIIKSSTLRNRNIAYSMGFTSKWIDPESYIGSFKNQYKNAMSLYGAESNYSVVTTGASWADLDGWGTSSYTMTHGSVRYDNDLDFDSSAEIFESKLGSYLRITHDRHGFKGDTYGDVLVSFEKD